MLKYIGKRILLFIPTLLIISLAIFFIIQLPPGDYVTSYVAAMSAEGEVFTLEQIADLRKQFGLDDPWLVQYFNWVKGIVTEGDFGYSFEYGRDVWSVIMDRLYLTLAVSFIILIFQYGVSLPIGIYCANHQYSAGDYVLLCSDGLTNMVEDSVLKETVLNQDASLKEKAESLVDLANKNGGRDNISLILVHI